MSKSGALPEAGSRAGRSLYPVLLPPLLLAVVVILALSAGKYDVSLSDMARVVWSRLTGTPSGLDATVETVVWNVRVPRVLAGLLVGASLAAAGCVYQGLFRNPLVSPDILGVSAGASLGAVGGIFLSLAAVALVYAIGSMVRGRDPVLVLVLAGVAVGALVGACISLLKVLADPYNQLPAITFWLLGSLASITRADAASILPAMLLGLVPMVLLRWRMNLMTLDEEEARALGVETGRLRLILVSAATLMTAAAVSVSGIIGWVGLVMPHIARSLVGPDFGRLLPASLMLGGGYMVGVDALARTIAGIEVPLGILTAVIGAPFFLWLLVSGRRGWQ
jgi:iron complex transport system permease protein